MRAIPTAASFAEGTVGWDVAYSQIKLTHLGSTTVYVELGCIVSTCNEHSYNNEYIQEHMRDNAQTCSK